ncbi:MAG: tetratricopeptide repeat protein [Nitrospirae bacterium]|nr:tetratricopeptide repeat protein [Nitrospirota bacterium]
MSGLIPRFPCARPLSFRKSRDGAVTLVFFTSLIVIFFVYAQAFAGAPEREKAAQLLKSAAKFNGEGETDRAIAAVEEAIILTPDQAEAREQLGTLLLKKKLFDDASRAFNEALKINPNMRSAKTGIGLALIGKGDLAGAEAALKNALTLNPYPAMTHYALGLLYQKMNNDEKALLHFKEGLRTYKEGKK